MTSFSTVFSVVPYRTTLTTTLPGFGWPNPVTSYSYSMSTTTITVVHSSPRGSPPRTTPSYPRTTNTPWRPDPPPPTTTYPPWPVADNPPGTPPPEITPPEIPPPEIPPPEITPEPPTQTTPKPPPWTPPATSHGPVWTPIANPNLPQPSPDQPAPLPTPSTQPAPVVPVPEGPAPIKCGPDVPEPCRGNTYCDPQPLCSIGEDCPGVCLPIVQLGFSNVSFIPGSPMPDQPFILKSRKRKRVLILCVQQRFTQSWDARREIWQKMLDDGLYVMYRYSI